MSGENVSSTPPDGGGDDSDWKVDGVDIPRPPPGSNLSTTGLRLYRWICRSLIKEGRRVGAAGIQITMLVHTLEEWLINAKMCASDGRYGIGEKGGRYEYPHSYNERAARESIKKELPEACLTVMSTVEARLKESKTQASGDQDDLFDDLLEHGQRSPRNDALH